MVISEKVHSSTYCSVAVDLLWELAIYSELKITFSFAMPRYPGTAIF